MLTRMGSSRIGNLPFARLKPARALRWFWASVTAGIGVLALALQILGPPEQSAVPARPEASSARPRADIAAPVPELQEPVPGSTSLFLPRIAADGRAPMRVYAAPFDSTDRRPRIGILLAGMGLNSADSQAAINGLPGAVSLAFSPYARPGAQGSAPLLEAARARGHEFLISLPLEPLGAPLHDAGDQALLVSATMEQNHRRLEWSLGRIGGYVGATGALGALRGERFAAASQPMRDMLHDLSARGLLYIDPRPEAELPAGTAGRAIDLVIDEVQQRVAIERALRRLEQMAHERGSALGLAGAPLPMTIGSLASWASGLEARGFVLAPMTALIGKPTSERAPETAAERVPERGERSH